MNILDKLKNFFNKIFGRNHNNNFEALLEEAKGEVEQPKPNLELEQENYIVEEYPENEIVPLVENGVLDASSKTSEEKFKHNLQVLVNKAKKTGKIDKFMLIREDNFFPHGWKWDVLSKNTNLEKENTALSFELRKAYALREAGIEPYTEIFGTIIPNNSSEKINEALSKVDKTIGNFAFPSKFRSTKHFTVNTALEVTGNYNTVNIERDYIIIDSMDNFLNSGYGYSASYHDAYLDVTHESLPISENAVVLIKDENYNRIISDPKVAEELSQRKVIRYKGETHLAINMVLTEMGVLPSTVGFKYINYDKETLNIIDNSIKNLARKNNLFFDKSHSGDGKSGHFTSYYDNKNIDYQAAVQESIQFLIKKFPAQQSLLKRYLHNLSGAEDIVQQIGIDELLGAINEYNEMATARAKIDLEAHNRERESITPEAHNQFTTMVSLINNFYNDVPFDSDFENKKEFEDLVKKFFHCDNIQEQQQSAKQLWKILKPRIQEQQESKKIETNKVNDDPSIDR